MFSVCTGVQETLKTYFYQTVTFKNNCPLGLLCGRRLKSDVRSFVRSFVRLFGYFAIFAFTNVTWDTKTGCYCLLKKLKVLILEPSSLNFLQARLYRLFFNFFQKLQKSPGVVSDGKMRKSDYVGPFPLRKTPKNTSFGRRELLIYVRLTSEHHFLNSSTQEPQGATMPCGCNLVIYYAHSHSNTTRPSRRVGDKFDTGCKRAIGGNGSKCDWTIQRS